MFEEGALLSERGDGMTSLSCTCPRVRARGDTRKRPSCTQGFAHALDIMYLHTHSYGTTHGEGVACLCADTLNSCACSLCVWGVYICGVCVCVCVCEAERAYAEIQSAEPQALERGGSPEDVRVVDGMVQVVAEPSLS